MASVDDIQKVMLGLSMPSVRIYERSRDDTCEEIPEEEDTSDAAKWLVKALNLMPQMPAPLSDASSMDMVTACVEALRTRKSFEECLAEINMLAPLVEVAEAVWLEAYEKQERGTHYGR